MKPNELMLGAAGEHLVVAELLLAGVQAYLTTQACPYDVAAEVGGRLVRIQVKATTRARPLQQKAQRHVTGYIWGLKRGRGRRRVYTANDLDMIAAVALDSRQIAWFLPKDVKQTVIIPVHGHQRGRRFADFSLARGLAGIVGAPEPGTLFA